MRITFQSPIVGKFWGETEVRSLAGAAVTAAVVGDASVCTGGQEQHLVLPGIRTQWPSVTKDDLLSRTPVLVANLRTILGRDRTHMMLRCS